MTRYTRLAIRLVAAKQDLVNLGFPEIIARFLYERYGKLAPMIANWYKQYLGRGERPDWWRLQSSFSRGPSLASLTHVYEVGVDPESLRQVGEHEDIGLDFYTQEEVDEFRRELVTQIRDKFFGETFFTYSPLMQDINSGKLTDVAPYKKLKFQDAEVKYDRRRHFAETTPLKVYDNGFKWIDAGKKSILLSKEMSNCGSSGVMSLDKDRTILALFGPTNKPHVMVVYSPNQGRISGDECAGGSEVKPEYHVYVLDLAQFLGVRFDAENSKSKELALRYQLRDKAESVELLHSSKYGDSYFRFVIDGEEFYTNGVMVVSGEDMDRIQGMLDRDEVEVRYPQENGYRTVLLQGNQHILGHSGVKYIPLREFIGA